jgi:hypothetical protein
VNRFDLDLHFAVDVGALDKTVVIAYERRGRTIYIVDWLEAGSDCAIDGLIQELEERIDKALCT